MIQSIPGISQDIASDASAPAKSPAKIHKAAQQFEALLIGQMLKTMTDSEGGWMGTGSDQAASSAMEYAQEMFAQALSSNGGLGLANIVVKGLNASTSNDAK